MERYNVIKAIGSGATSEVFLVEDKRSKRPYIMKQMATNGMTDQERARAKQEVSVLQKIDHANIVRYRESFSTPDAICIVMERCATSLESIIDRKRDDVERGVGSPFPTSLLLEWMAELLCAVHYLHANHILHRDIKPSNVFVTDTNHLKLGDFGVCKVLAGAAIRRSVKIDSVHPAASAIIASQGAMLGTPLYLSPEIFEEDEPVYSQASDIWALGAVFYEMCALHPAFEADNFFALIHKISNGPLPPPLTNGVDQRFENIARVMMNRNPKQRPSAQQLIDKFVVVPLTHPSHPAQRPEHGRLLQRHHGLALDVSSSEDRSADTSSLGNTRGSEAHKAPSSEREETQSPAPPVAAPVVDERSGSHSSSDGHSDPPPRRVSPKSEVVKKVKQSAVNVVAANNAAVKHSARPAANANSSPSANLGPSEDHEAALKRIRSAKSKIDVGALRKSMMERRANSAGLDASTCSAEIPTEILCPIAAHASPHVPRTDRSPPARSPSHNSHKDPHEMPNSTVTPDRPPLTTNQLTLGEWVQQFLNDSALEQHVTLEDMDEVAMLLNQYKLRRFGVY